METRVVDIAAKNDLFRSKLDWFQVTQGICERIGEIGSFRGSELMNRVINFSDFTKVNDPHGEHDFGSFKLYGEKVFWKIDYYDQELRGWCDPLSDTCRRVLTILLAEEW